MRGWDQRLVTRRPCHQRCQVAVYALSGALPDVLVTLLCSWHAFAADVQKRPHSAFPRELLQAVAAVSKATHGACGQSGGAAEAERLDARAAADAVAASLLQVCNSDGTHCPQAPQCQSEHGTSFRQVEASDILCGFVHTHEQACTEEPSLDLDGCRMRRMRPRLLQGRGHASTRAKRVVAAARSEERATLLPATEELRFEDLVVATATSACQWRFSRQVCCRAGLGAVYDTPWCLICSMSLSDTQKTQVVSA
jgi:hypothetical protein